MTLEKNYQKEPPSPPCYCRRHSSSTTIIFAVALACFIVSCRTIIIIKSTHVPAPMLLDAGAEGFIDLSLATDADAAIDQEGLSQYPIDETDFIIQKSYAETYARMFPCKDEVEADCISLVVKHLHDENNQNQNQNQNSTTTQQNPHYFQVSPNHPYPWWFQTLLRDIPSNGAYGWWHHFSTNATNPPLRFCAIGKNGSSEWRGVFNILNAPEYCEEDDDNDKKWCTGSKKFNTKAKLSDDPLKTHKTVFIRDPLERLLSGYLDKCFKPNVRVSQGHCTPNTIFGVDHLERQKQQGKKDIVVPPDLTNVIQNMDKEMFATYVDLLPLKWNVHFVPQAIFCDLYRNIGTYDFVGVMGKQFMPELDRMADRYGGTLPVILNNTFNYKSKLDSESNGDAANNNVGADNSHGTKAPEKVAKYYSARAIRRALEYLSIDYVSLGLQVPVWAKEMLLDDNNMARYQ